MTRWQAELADRKRESWKVFWGGVAIMIFVLLLGFVATSPANASMAVASAEELAAAQCRLQVYEGRHGMADMESCTTMLYLPTSAAFKCSLYKDSGYPSPLMEKACLLFDLGYIQSFTEDASSALD